MGLADILKPHIYERKGYKMIKMRNYARDFSGEFVYRGITKGGRVKLGEIHTEGPNRLEYRNIMGNVYSDSSGKKRMSTLGHRYHLDL